MRVHSEVKTTEQRVEQGGAGIGDGKVARMFLGGLFRLEVPL